LRKVDENDLIAQAGRGVPLSKSVLRADRLLAAEGLSELFGLEMAEGEPSATPATADRGGKGARARRQRSAGVFVVAPGAKARTDSEQAASRPAGKIPEAKPPKRRTKAEAARLGTRAKTAKPRTNAKAPKRRTKAEPAKLGTRPKTARPRTGAEAPERRAKPKAPKRRTKTRAPKRRTKAKTKLRRMATE
jgi:hypothetical protein